LAGPFIKTQKEIKTMTTPCDNCDIQEDFEALKERVEKVYDLAQAAEVSQMRREYPRGWRDALRKVIEVLEEK
jgi:hypothetical protein